MMDLDSAIQHCKEQVQEQAKKGCYSCAEEHQQLAEWLKELKAYKEQSGDAISRQAVFEQIGSWIISGEYGFTNATEYLSKRIKALPSVTPQQRTGRWIPISERLPDKATRVLTSWIYEPTGAKYIEVAERYGDGDNYTFFGDTDEYKMNRKDHKVTAWMPLPEPYKAESEV